jgi:hypothetical protein
MAAATPLHDLSIDNYANRETISYLSPQAHRGGQPPV